MRTFLVDFLMFGLKEARACLFAVAFFTLLLLSRHLPLFGLARYDFLCLAAIAVQIVLLATGFESWGEALVLCAFHVLGLTLELFKTHPAIASWSYPEAGVLKIGTVPLYSGFMYAAVASYMCQAWRLLRLELIDYPYYRLSVPLWIAENVSTYLGDWVYPQQRVAWQIVSVGILGSWSLLVIISFILVAGLKHVRRRGPALLRRPLLDMIAIEEHVPLHFLGQRRG